MTVTYKSTIHGNDSSHNFYATAPSTFLRLMANLHEINKEMIQAQMITYISHSLSLFHSALVKSKEKINSWFDLLRHRHLAQIGHSDENSANLLYKKEKVGWWNQDMKSGTWNQKINGEKV